MLLQRGVIFCVFFLQAPGLNFFITLLVFHALTKQTDMNERSEGKGSAQTEYLRL